MKRRLQLDPAEVPLPKGTRVVLQADLPARDGWLCKRGTVGRVEEVDHPRYVVGTTHGHTVELQRHQVVVQQARLEEVAGERHWAWEHLAEHVVLEVVVGSVAWGLDDEESDEDLRGAFLLPFDLGASLWAAPDELHPAGQERQLWEVEKLVRQGLRADANVLETLYSPRVRRQTEVGTWLREGRELFVSQRLHGSFGRYALSQLHKLRRKVAQHQTHLAVVQLLREHPGLERAELVRRLEAVDLGDEPRDELLRRVIHGFHDRGVLPSRTYDDLRAHLATRPPDPDPYRPKNAYNLLRLLHSALSWARTGVPLVRVEDPTLRARLLAIKRGEADLDGVIAEATAVAAEVDEAMATTALPEEPDLDGADALLRRCRTWAARRAFQLAPVRPTLPRRAAGPPDETLDLALARGWTRQTAAGRDVVLCAVSGAHLYGFPSPDSDLDLKGLFLSPAATVLRDGPDPTLDLTEVVDGVELDLTLLEAGHAVALLLRGNGNLLEQLASPWVVLPEPEDGAEVVRRAEELRALALAGVHRGLGPHYLGYLASRRRAVAQRGTLKAWLYAYRVALTGLHLARTGEVVADLRPLATAAGLTRVAELVAAKREGPEHGAAAGLAAVLEGAGEELDGLQRALHEAWEASSLPVSCPTASDLRDWLGAWRSTAVRGTGP